MYFPPKVLRFYSSSNISDNRGITTDVFIPIQEREGLKFKCLEEVDLGKQSKNEIF